MKLSPTILYRCDNLQLFVFSSPSRQHKLEEALLFSGQFAEALQALVDWLYRVEPQLAEDLPVHGDLDLVSNLMDSHKVKSVLINMYERIIIPLKDLI